jgi:hypothetical protein
LRAARQLSFSELTSYGFKQFDCNEVWAAVDSLPMLFRLRQAVKSASRRADVARVPSAKIGLCKSRTHRDLNDTPGSRLKTIPV